MNLLVGYLAGAVFGYLGYRAKALTVDGAIAACLVGGTIFGFGGIGWAILLIVFFVSSSALSFVGGKNRRKQTAAETFDKGGRRDAWQVIANGGVAAVAALGFGSLVPNLDLMTESQYGLIGLCFGAFLGALAAATADTWATEIGTLSKNEPRLITSGKKVQAGTSGGITALGTGAALGGTIIIGLVGVLVFGFLRADFPLLTTINFNAIFAAALVGGLGGMLADSLLGATLQAQYYCPVCRKPTESKVHRCGTPTAMVSGVAWINNDIVNLAGTLAGGILGLLVALIMPFVVLSLF